MSRTLPRDRTIYGGVLFIFDYVRVNHDFVKSARNEIHHPGWDFIAYKMA